MDWSQAQALIKELTKITAELRRVADAMTDTVRDGSPFIDPYGDEERDS